MGRITWEMPKMEPPKLRPITDFNAILDNPMPAIRTLVEHSLVKRASFVMSWQELPARRGIYFVFDREREAIAYIGKSTNLRQRWAGHALRQELEAKTDCEYAEMSDWKLAWLPPDDSRFMSLEHEEATYIAILNPQLNRLINCTL